MVEMPFVCLLVLCWGACSGFTIRKGMSRLKQAAACGFESNKLTMLQPRHDALIHQTIIHSHAHFASCFFFPSQKYYEERGARKQARKAKAAAKQGVGTQNNGWDDENFDYIFSANEIIDNRYKLIKRIGKGSLLSQLKDNDPEDEHHIGK